MKCFSGLHCNQIEIFAKKSLLWLQCDTVSKEHHFNLEIFLLVKHCIMKVDDFESESYIRKNQVL